RGVLALQRAQPDEAVSHLRRAVGLHPNNVPMEINLAAALNADKRFDEALSVLARVIAASPQSAEAHYQAGLSHQQLDNLPAAATSFTEAVRLRPDWPA